MLEKCLKTVVFLCLVGQTYCQELSPNFEYYRARGAIRKLLSKTLDGQSSIRSDWKVSRGHTKLTRVASLRDEQPRLISNADSPERLVMVCGTRTVDEVNGVIGALATLNERRKDCDPIRLHLITSADYVLPHIQKGASTSFVEINQLFHSNDVWLRDFGLWVQSKSKVYAVDACRSGDLPGLSSILARMASAELIVPEGLSDNMSGNFGGNVIVTPNDVAIVGSTSQPRLRDFLDDYGYEKRMVIVDTSWLEVGHIDELLVFLPLPGKEGKWAIVRSSGRLALSLLKQMEKSDFHKEVEKAVRNLRNCTIGALPEDERYEVTEMMTQLSLLNSHLQGRTSTSFEYTPALIELNEDVDKMLDAAVQMVKEVVKESCPNEQEPVVIELPSLFIDSLNGARSLAPNVVNLVCLDDELLIPCPLCSFLRDETKKRLEQFGYKTHFIKTLTYHALGGGLHCATTVLRRPR